MDKELNFHLNKASIQHLVYHFGSQEYIHQAVYFKESSNQNLLHQDNIRGLSKSQRSLYDNSLKDLKKLICSYRFNLMQSIRNFENRRCQTPNLRLHHRNHITAVGMCLLVLNLSKLYHHFGKKNSQICLPQKVVQQEMISLYSELRIQKQRKSRSSQPR